MLIDPRIIEQIIIDCKNTLEKNFIDSKEIIDKKRIPLSWFLIKSLFL